MVMLIGGAPVIVQRLDEGRDGKQTSGGNEQKVTLASPDSQTILGDLAASSNGQREFGGALEV